LASAKCFITHISFKKPHGKMGRVRGQVDKLTNKVSNLTVGEAADVSKLCIFSEILS
jgi:hypothetical protein